jgi:hypothetical protein
MEAAVRGEPWKWKAAIHSAPVEFWARRRQCSDSGLSDQKAIRQLLANSGREEAEQGRGGCYCGEPDRLIGSRSCFRMGLTFDFNEWPGRLISESG